ncbi:hypothetical protein AZI98_15985 [Aeribacillus pallidus]|uniref:Uncharacterized protein n=1 Tax=Aeribacillus pallidus TaxID=33936 RepID=A0A165WMV1_9BACI|nr:hypothetical protein AZI98_15985 [Aeribacillus pallidus]
MAIALHENSPHNSYRLLNEFVNKKDLNIAAGHPPSTTYGDLTIRRLSESGKGHKNLFRFKK